MIFGRGLVESLNGGVDRLSRFGDLCVESIDLRLLLIGWLEVRRRIHVQCGTEEPPPVVDHLGKRGAVGLGFGYLFYSF